MEVLYLERVFSANKTLKFLSCCMATFFSFEETLVCGSTFAVLYGFWTGLFAAFVFTSVCTDTFSAGGFFDDDLNAQNSETVDDDDDASSLLVTFFWVF